MDLVQQELEENEVIRNNKWFQMSVAFILGFSLLSIAIGAIDVLNNLLK